MSIFDFWANWTGTGSFSEAFYYSQAHGGGVRVWGTWSHDVLAPKAKGSFFGLFSSGFPRTGGPADPLRDELEGQLHARQENMIRRQQAREETRRANLQNRRAFVVAPMSDFTPPNGYQSMDRLWASDQGGWEW